MTTEELLLNLQDIQPPPELPWWLLPPSLWGALVMLLLLPLLLTWYRRRDERRRPGTDALAELDRIAARHASEADDAALVRSLAHWLKRVALQAYPDQGLESICGDRWLEFLDRSFDSSDFSQGHGVVFGDAVYRRTLETDPAALLALCRDWLRQVQPRLAQGRADC